jgi:crotonobetainyl-CoA:carnitine CoA-transferase CaiB-like acyl-CoA transferase
VALGLRHRERTGEGCYAVVPQRDGIIGLVGEYMVAESLGYPLPTQTGNRDPQFAPHNVYRTRDEGPRQTIMPSGEVTAEIFERWLAVAVDSEEAWQALRLLVADARLDDPRYETVDGRREALEDIDAVIADWASERDANEAAAELQAVGVAAASMMTPLLATTDPHLEARGMFLPYDHPDAGHQRATAPPWHMRRRPVTALRPAPRFGEHTAQVLRDVAGYDDETIDQLSASGVTANEVVPSPAG